MASSRKSASANKPAFAAAPADFSDEPVLAALHEALANWLARYHPSAPSASIGSDAVSSGAISTDTPLIAVAFSGGLDSSVLLDAAARIAPNLGVRVVAFHVHHGLNPDAGNWLGFCTARAAALGVAFDARHVTVPQELGIGVEAAARMVRYAALHDMSREHGACCLLVAHHADDQAETVLLQLLRGGGLPGVAGMTAQTSSNVATNVPVLRPWLDVTRVQLHAYADTRALPWIDDSSNQDRRYLRNALRHDVMPAIARHVPSYRGALARFARHAAQAQALLDELAAQDLLPTGSGTADRLNQSALCQLSDARLGNLLRYWLGQLGQRTISEARLADWVRQIRSAGRETHLKLAHEGGVLRLYRGWLSWQAAEPRMMAAKTGDETDTLPWAGERRWSLPRWHGYVTFSPCTETDASTGIGVPESCLRSSDLIARPRSGGERLQSHPNRPRKTLKNLFQEANVPPWQRDVPIIWLRGRILFVPHLGCDSDWLSAQGSGRSEPRWCLTWHDLPEASHGAASA